MIVDKELYFSDNQTITADAASTNVIKNGEGGGAFADPMHFVVIAEDTPSSTDQNAKVKISLEHSDSETNNYSEVFSFEVKISDIVGGKTIFSSFLPYNLKKYLRVYYDITATAAINNLKITSFLTKNV